MQSPSLVMAAYQQSLQRVTDVLANNIANASTTGFKRQNNLFDTLVVQPATNQPIRFAVDAGTYRDTAQGAMQTTGNPLDLAIQGKGYFQVETPQGPRFTRGGAFVMNNAGEITTVSGLKLLADGGQPIVLPGDASDIHISADGVVTARVGNATEVTQFGRIVPVKFANEQKMVAVGNSLYRSDAPPEPDPDSRVAQGMIERSNVEPVRELTKLIEITRSYTQLGRMLEQDNQRRSDAINKLARVSV